MKTIYLIKLVIIVVGQNHNVFVYPKNECKMEFKIGDKVKLKRGNYNHVGEIIDILECDIIGSNKIDKKSLKELALEYLAVDSIVK